MVISAVHTALSCRLLILPKGLEQEAPKRHQLQSAVQLSKTEVDLSKPWLLVKCAGPGTPSCHTMIRLPFLSTISHIMYFSPLFVPCFPTPLSFSQAGTVLHLLTHTLWLEFSFLLSLPWWEKYAQNEPYTSLYFPIPTG